MMNRRLMNRNVPGLLAGVLLLSGLVQAQERRLPFEVNNRVRVEHDDNIYQTSEDQQDSFKFIEELELIKNMQFDQSLISMRYSPSFVYWTDREDDNDLHHQVDALLKHQLNDRFGISASELYRYAELPEVIAVIADESTVVREKSDYSYNALSLGGNAKFSELTTGNLDFRWNSLAYDRSDVAGINDYNQYIYGGTLNREVGKRSTVGAELRFSDYVYEDEGRDAFGTQIGVVGDYSVTARSKFNGRVGYEFKEFDDANTDSAESPYLRGSYSFAPGPGTVAEVGASFSLTDAPVSPYANAESTTLYGRFAHDITPKVNLNLIGLYTVSSYDREETAATSELESIPEGEENVLRLSSKLSFRINTQHSVEANLQFTDLASDIRSDLEYDRTRLSLGWRVQL